MKEIVELISNHGVSIIIVGLFIMDYLNNKNKTTQVIERIDRTTEKVGEPLEELKVLNEKQIQATERLEKTYSVITTNQAVILELLKSQAKKEVR